MFDMISLCVSGVLDEIHLASKVGSTVNSEINSPDKAHVEFKNVKVGILVCLWLL